MNRVYQGNEEVIQRIRSSFDREYFVQPPQYSNARIKYDDCIITIYDSGKVMFQGANAGIYAATFFPEKEITLPQCGSDEVGTGDYSDRSAYVPAIWTVTSIRRSKSSI